MPDDVKSSPPCPDARALSTGPTERSPPESIAIIRRPGIDQADPRGTLGSGALPRAPPNIRNGATGATDSSDAHQEAPPTSAVDSRALRHPAAVFHVEQLGRETQRRTPDASTMVLVSVGLARSTPSRPVSPARWKPTGHNRGRTTGHGLPRPYSGAGSRTSRVRLQPRPVDRARSLVHRGSIDWRGTAPIDVVSSDSSPRRIGDADALAAGAVVWCAG